MPYNYITDYIIKLSGDEHRAIETYTVLKQRANIDLLDEPFSNIAPLYVEKIKTLKTSEKTHKAIITTDHYFRDVIDICDGSYLLNNDCTKKTPKQKNLNITTTLILVL